MHVVCGARVEEAGGREGERVSHSLYFLVISYQYTLKMFIYMVYEDQRLFVCCMCMYEHKKEKEGYLYLTSSGQRIISRALC